MSYLTILLSTTSSLPQNTNTEVKYHPVEIIAKMLKSFWAVNKTGLNSYSVSNIMMIDFKLNRQFWKQFYLKATTKKTIDIGMLQRLGIQVLSAIIIHFVIVWPISTAFLWFSCDRLDWTRWSGKLQPFVYIRFEVFVNVFRCIQPLPAKDSTAM